MEIKSKPVLNDEAMAGQACGIAESPLFGRVPGLLSIATFPAALAVNPALLGFAGIMLGVIGLILSGRPGRQLSLAGIVLGAAAMFIGLGSSV